mmetsp:Transcript_6361/g.14018  ORF Transcript_6361/g.14018 Transcript_6361/m.14018 type:complete len:215 (-) Transcript_6361:869-1513(-)
MLANSLNRSCSEHSTSSSKLHASNCPSNNVPDGHIMASPTCSPAALHWAYPLHPIVGMAPAVPAEQLEIGCISQKSANRSSKPLPTSSGVVVKLITGVAGVVVTPPDDDNAQGLPAKQASPGPHSSPPGQATAISQFSIISSHDLPQKLPFGLITVSSSTTSNTSIGSSTPIGIASSATSIGLGTLPIPDPVSLGTAQNFSKMVSVSTQSPVEK